MEPGNLEARVGALETQVRALAGRIHTSEQNPAAARVLAGAADRDVTEFMGEFRVFRQATVSSFNATREDLSDLREDLTDLRTAMNDGFEHVDNGFIEMRGKLDATAAGQQQIVGLIQTIIADQGGNGPA